MVDLARIADVLRRAYHEGLWGGGPIGLLFQSLTAAEARAHPVPGAHSAWEIALHLRAWHDIFRRRLLDDQWEAQAAADWPGPVGSTREAWEADHAGLERGLDALVLAVQTFDPERLLRTVSGKTFSFLDMLTGIPQHDQYHACQERMLKAALAGRAST